MGSVTLYPLTPSVGVAPTGCQFDGLSEVVDCKVKWGSAGQLTTMLPPETLTCGVGALI